MSSVRRIFGGRKASVVADALPLVPTDGEINFLWSFIQGSIMIEETWQALLRGYGFCERHAWIHISVEMSFRDDYLLGPTILYGELIDKAIRAMGTRPKTRFHLAGSRLRAEGPCLLCALNVKNASAGACPRLRLERGRDGSRLDDFATELKPLWRGCLCAECSGQEAGAAGAIHCRQHLLASADRGAFVDWAEQKAMLEDLSAGLARQQRSFVVGGAEASNRDRAALIAAAGWCSGWRPLLARLS